MTETNIPDQSIVNIEAYLMNSGCPSEIALNFAKMATELRRRRFDAFDNWRGEFVRYSKHLPICELLLHTDSNNSRCTCNLIELMKKANK